MNRMFPGILIGFVCGAGLVLLTKRAPAPPTGANELAHPLLVSQEENRRLAARVEELEKAAKAPTPPPTATKSEPPAPKPDLAAKFAVLAEKGLAALQDKGLGEVIELAKNPEGVAFLAERLLKGETSQERFLAAAALGALQDPAGLAAMSEALAKDPDDLVRRMLSQAMGRMANPAAEAPLRAAMTGDKDWGVRVNSAYGLAKLGKDDGLRLLESSYSSAETPAEYRLGILGGLADVGSPTSVPLFRRILAETKDVGYLLTAIHGLAKTKDAAARADLERLAASEDVTSTVREAARKAVAEMSK